MSFSGQTIRLLMLGGVLFSLGACKKSQDQAVPSTGQVQSQEVKVDLREKINQTFTKQELTQIGEKVYQTKGMQTCLQCHRGHGEGEGYAGAAVLQKPWTWRSFNALGGYDALKANPKEFREKLEISLAYLIHGGALHWNNNFAKDHPEIVYDWTKTGKDKYDMMMWGVAQSETKVKVKEIQKELEAAGKKVDDNEMSWIAAVAALEYLKSFEKPGKGADGKPASKIWE